VLVVCHANVARSVAAACLLDGSTDERGVAIELRTAGTHATDGQPTSARTRRALEAMHGDAPTLVAHRSRALTEADLEWADLVIAMEASQVRFVRRRHPEAAGRAATIAVLAHGLPADDRVLATRIAVMGLAALEDGGASDVIDPAGGDDATYAATVDELAELCGRLRVRLAGTAASTGSRDLRS
jgi:protein-tyrosine-phosphatase